MKKAYKIVDFLNEKTMATCKWPRAWMSATIMHVRAQEGTEN